MMSDLNLSHGKIPDFVSYSSLGFTLAIKLRNFDFENLWNTLIFYFDQSKCNVRFKYVQWNMSDVVSFPLFGFTLVIKLRTFDFESRWNILTLFTIWEGGGGTLCTRQILSFVVAAARILRKWNFWKIPKIYQGFWIKNFFFKNFVFSGPFVCTFPEIWKMVFYIFTSRNVGL